MIAIVEIMKLSLRLTGMLFLLSGLEELVRRDVASSNLAGFLLVLAGVLLTFAARAIGTSGTNDTVPLSRIIRGNEVLSRTLEKRSGQIGMSVFITGIISSVLSAAILRLNIYSLALFSGFGIILLGLIWMLSATVTTAFEVFRDATAARK